MGYGKIIAGGLLAVSLGACVSIPREQTVAEYCANPKKANENVCRLKVEIDGTATRLADTDMRVGEARKMADNAMAAAGRAQSSAEGAQATANSALSMANAAMNRKEEMICETRTIQKTNVGSCRPGYKVTSCTQTRFTYRSGGPSILREINDEQCRFNDRVLEMQVRCCGTASSAPQPVNALENMNQPETVTRTETKETSPLRY